MVELELPKPTEEYYANPTQGSFQHQLHLLKFNHSLFVDSNVKFTKPTQKRTILNLYLTDKFESCANDPFLLL